MSGFLSRVAARAVGQAPVARPKVPSVFEGTRASSAEGGLEIVETEVAAQPLSRPGTRSAEPAPSPARAVQALRRVEVESDGQTPAAPATSPEPSAAPARPREAAAPLSGAETGPPGEPTHEVRLTGRLVEDRPPAAETAVAEPAAQAEPAAATAVAAVPAARAKPEFASHPAPAPAQVAGAATAIAEAPAVRVHIGRLEVRASLQEAPSRRTLRTEPEPAGESLADYLRGRRAAS